MTDNQVMNKVNDMLKDARWARNGGQTLRAQDDVDKAQTLLESQLN